MNSGTEQKAVSPRVTLWQLAKVFAQMGASGFGSSMLPYYRSRLVKDLKWVNEEEFLRALKIGQSLPGLNATNMSVIFGDRLAGPMGSIVATIAVLLPGAVSLCLTQMMRELWLQVLGGYTWSALSLRLIPDNSDAHRGGYSVGRGALLN